MKVALEIAYRGVEKNDAIENLVREKVAKLEQFCDYMNSCRVAIEKAHEHPKSGSPYRVRLDITIPPGHELAVVENPGTGNQYVPLETVIRDAFEAARRQVVELAQRQRSQVKEHPQQEMTAVVTKLFPDYGFLRTLDTAREIYFHRNSLINHDFEELRVGTGVQFAESVSSMGTPQASSVRVIERASSRTESSGEPEIEPPLGWQS